MMSLLIGPFKKNQPKRGQNLWKNLFALNSLTEWVVQKTWTIKHYSSITIIHVVVAQIVGQRQTVVWVAEGTNFITSQFWSWCPWRPPCPLFFFKRSEVLCHGSCMGTIAHEGSREIFICRVVTGTMRWSASRLLCWWESSWQLAICFL